MLWASFPPTGWRRPLTTRDEEKTALLDALVAEELLPAGEAPPVADIMAAAHAFVARSPAALVMAQTDDLAGERVAVNLPGTSNERPNWRRKIATPVPELLTTPTAQTILAKLRAARAEEPPQKPVADAAENG